MLNGVRTLLRFDWREDKRFVLFTVAASVMGALLPILNALLPLFVYRCAAIGSLESLGLLLLCYLLVRYGLSAGILKLSKVAFVLRTRLAARFSLMLHREICRADYPWLEDPDYLLLKERAQKFIYADWHGFSYQVDQLFDMLGQLVSLLLLGVLLGRLNPWVPVAALAASLLTAISAKRMRHREAQHTLEAVHAERQWHYFDDLYDSLPYAKDIRLFGLQEWLLNKEAVFAEGVCQVYKKRATASFRAEGMSVLLEALALGGLVAYLLMGTSWTGANVGELLTFFYAMHAFVSTAQGLVQSATSLSGYEVYHQSLDQFLRLTRSTRNANGIPVPAPPFVFEFRDVSFRYPGQREDALSGINCTFSTGEQIGIVGENGAGKSTFVKLLLGMYRPTSGTVLLNGTDISALDDQAYRRLFSCVFQDLRLFDFSIKDNLCLGADIPDASLDAVLAQFRLTALVIRQSKGVHTPVGRLFDQEGFIPSGGEEQRLALCRVFLHRRPVIVLDEPTSALDPKAEDALYKSVAGLATDRLVVLITHRLASAKDCHRILVFQEGRLIGSGSHVEIMAQKEHYYTLYTTQAAHYQSGQ